MSLPIKIENFLLEQNTDLIHLETVGSTMKEIKKHTGDKNICLIADEQTEGIGRRGNEWVSPKGNIYLSFLFKYNLSIEHHFLFTAVAANSIILCLNNYINENIYIKWPNDIIINGGKIASLRNSIEELISILQKHNIISKRFFAGKRDRSINLANECERIYKEK